MFWQVLLLRNLSPLVSSLFLFQSFKASGNKNNMALLFLKSWKHSRRIPQRKRNITRKNKKSAFEIYEAFYLNQSLAFLSGFEKDCDSYKTINKLKFKIKQFVFQVGLLSFGS